MRIRAFVAVRWVALASLGAALLLPGCGETRAEVQTLLLGIEPVVDRSGTVSNSGFVGRGTDLAIGDSNFDESARGFYSFPLDGAPLDITNATLYTTQFMVTGTPYTDLGPRLQVDHVQLSGPLAASDYDLAGVPIALVGGPGVTVISFDVTAALRAAVQARAANPFFTVRFRYALETDSDAQGDFVNLADPLNQVNATTAPILQVLYRTAE